MTANKQKEKVDDDTDGEKKEQPMAHAAAVSSIVGDPSLTAHAPDGLKEDLEWRAKLESVTGPASQDAIQPAERVGPLWDMYRKAISEGFEVCRLKWMHCQEWMNSSQNINLFAIIETPFVHAMHVHCM